MSTAIWLDGMHITAQLFVWLVCMQKTLAGPLVPSCCTSCPVTGGMRLSRRSTGEPPPPHHMRVDFPWVGPLWALDIYRVSETNQPRVHPTPYNATAPAVTTDWAAPYTTGWEPSTGACGLRIASPPDCARCCQASSADRSGGSTISWPRCIRIDIAAKGVGVVLWMSLGDMQWLPVNVRTDPGPLTHSFTSPACFTRMCSPHHLCHLRDQSIHRAFSSNAWHQRSSHPPTPLLMYTLRGGGRRGAEGADTIHMPPSAPPCPFASSYQGKNQV